MALGKGLILVFDLDQTLVGWYSDNSNEPWSPAEMKFRFNTRLLSVLKECFLSKEAGVVSTIMVLSNNTNPEEAIAAIEKKVGSKFDFVVGRNHPLRDTTTSTVKDLATISRVVGYDVEPNKVWLIDDMRHKMVTEGVHWIHVAKQENNPYGSGFSEDPDLTDYSPLQNAIHAYVRTRGGRQKTKRRNQKKRRHSKNKKRNRA